MGAFRLTGEGGAGRQRQKRAGSQGRGARPMRAGAGTCRVGGGGGRGGVRGGHACFSVSRLLMATPSGVSAACTARYTQLNWVPCAPSVRAPDCSWK